jgi:hypothetical protein
MNHHFMWPFIVAEQLQVSMETVGLGFSRKIQICAGMAVHKTNLDWNTSGTGRINFWRRKRSRHIA